MRWCGAWIVVLVSGCAWFGDDDGLEVRGPVIAEVVEALPEVTVPEVQMPPPSRAEVMAAYERVYGQIPERSQNFEVGKRLADLEMEIGVEQDVAGGEAAYDKAIGMYEALLLEADREHQDAILYQLARAHDIAGHPQPAADYLDRLIEGFPDSEYILEARFRRAENRFSKDRYAEAAEDYGYVVAQGNDSAYWRNALYMLGWCQFKTYNYDASLDSFFAVVDSLVAKESGAPLGAADQELLDDTLRVVVLGVSYLDGPTTLAVHMERLGKPEWQHRVYERLAEDYRSKERYLDSVATLETFIAHNDLDRRAPVFHQQVIDILIEADFPSEIRSRKEAFVRRYGVRSEFWTVHDAEARADYMPALKSYLDELSALAHSEAQASGTVADYLAAADWYEQIVETFPDDPQVPEHLFLLGDVYTDAGLPERAIPPYRRVMREFADYPKAAEAGYAVVLAHAALLEGVDPADLELARHEQIDAQIEFAERFPSDPRAAAVEADAADSLFALGDYERAVGLAERVLDLHADVPTEIQRTALLVIGHGRFELAQYAAAEQAYRALLTLPPDPTGAVAAEDISERLLASIYRQAEVAEAAGDLDAAVEHFLRLRSESPGSLLAAQGLYDAIAVVEGQGQWLRAAELLGEFRASYPNHELAADIDKRMAGLYEHANAWDRAADEYSRVAAADPDAEVRAQALYRAAELYLEVDDVDNAIVSFEDYANTFAEPVDPLIEAIEHLDRLYQRTGDETRRRYWLSRKIQLADTLGERASDRLKYLAAEAQAAFAAEERARFDAVALRAPLPESLAAKRDALTRCVAAYEKMASYGIQQFATEATFETADLYAALSRALLESERPPGLSDMELEQYEILLEEQAFPFEEQAIAIHEINTRRSWEGTYDDWVQRSFAALRVLMPARFDKQEIEVGYVDTIR